MKKLGYLFLFVAIRFLKVNILGNAAKNQESRKVHLVSLGCARNRVDSEVMLGGLYEKGWVHSMDPADCQAIIVNTCGFIEAAKEESIDNILQFSEYKKSNPDLKLVVSGCLSQRYKTQLAKGLPEVDFFLGTDEFTKVGELLDRETPAGAVFAKRTHYIYNETLPRVNTSSPHWAYVKVAEGCQHNCSFCIIPAIRGKLRSRPMESVKKEVENLVQNGVSEVNLIAQDLAAYGRDHSSDLNLLGLLQSLVKVEGLKWLRLLYMYPENITDEFLDFFANEPKLVKYLDIPVQHANDKVLGRMNRQVTSGEIESVIAKVRARVPGVAIRTSVMVGFPGETEEQFESLAQFVEKVKFDHLGCFSYSQEEGTVAGRMKDQISEEEKQKRLEKIMSIQQEVSKESLKKYVGQVFPVLVTDVEKTEEGFSYKGRLSTQAPEVDGVVFLKGEAQLGKTYSVLIEDSFDYDLGGALLKIC